MLVVAAFLSFVAFSCAKNAEEEAPEVRPAGKQTSIEAYVIQPQDPEATKTDYTIDETNKTAVFSWVDGDHIDAVVTKGTTVSSVVFTKQTDDSEHTNWFLDGELDGQPTLAQRSGYALGDLAFYPSRVSPEAQGGGFAADWSYENGKFQLDLPASITLPSSKPLSIVPMVGEKDTEGKYAFTQPVGVLAVKVENLPLEADFISIHSDNYALAGSFELTKTGGVYSIAARAATSDVEKTLTQHFSGITGEYTFYFSLPVGENVYNGLKLTVGSSSDEDLRMTKTIAKPINVPRGTIVRAPKLTFAPVDPQWASFGTATFKDDFLWKNNTAFASVSSVTVNLERSGANPNKFRINNPYSVASTQVNYTQTDPDQYFVFLIAEDGTISYPDFKTGVKDSDGFPMKLVMTGSSRVVSSQKSGDFLELVFSSRYSLYTPDSEHPNQYWTRSDVIHLTVNVSETWTKALDGTFIDEKMWGLHGWGSTRVPIELYQSDQIDGHYRVPNPYLIAKEQFSYNTYEAGISGDEFLYFSIEDGDAVRFTTFLAGIEDINTGGKSMKVWYPLDWGSGYTTQAAKNLVASYRSDGLPAEIELYPIYSNATTLSYQYTDQGSNRIRLSFPEPETWKSVSTLQFKDDFVFSSIHGKPVDSHVEVQLEQSSLNPKRFRFGNPYPALCDALEVSKYTAGVSEFFVFTVADDNTITYDEFRPGVGDSTVELMICEPSDWNSKRNGGWDATVGKSRVVSYDANGIPLFIKLFGVYHQVDNYIGPGQDGNHMYTRDSDAYGDVMVLAASIPVDSWTSIGEGRFKDKLVWSCAGLTDYATADFQQNDNYPNQFRVSKPYPGANSGEWFVFDVTDPDKVTSVNYYVDHEVTAPGKATFKPWIRNGVDYGYNFSKVLGYQSNGLPSVVEIGPCYRGDEWYTADDSVYTTYEIGRDHEVCAIEIIFPGCDPYYTVTVTHYDNIVEKSYNGGHNPIANLSFPVAGSMEKAVIKISGVDLAKVDGLALYGPSGWMHSGYVAPDANGVVTIDSFSYPDFSGGIDINLKMNADAIGDVIRIDVQEIVVSGASYTVSQDKDHPHYPGIIVNDGGNAEIIRGSSMTVTGFRIPALVTSNAGTLIGAYDVRYDGYGDLQGDIDVGVKRSTDGGKTWSPLIIAMDMGITGYESEVAAGTMTEKQARLNNGIGDPCLLVDENTGRIFCFAVWGHGHYDDSDRRCLAWAGKGFEIADTPQFMMAYSDDDGETWSEPINITRQIKKYDWRMTFQGPGRGITMSNGTLVIPIQHQEGETRNMHGLYPLNSGIAYSTDHGETWHAHNFAYPITSESAVAEIEPGVLLLTMRDETDSHTRRNYITTDMGRTWTKHASDGKLIDSTCEASILHVNASDNILGKDLVLFSNPKNPSGRSRITIQASEDKGVTWNHSLLIDAGGSLGYTCLTMIDNATVGILYESSRGDILFQAIPLTDIVNN